jgi:hypothetical protein
LPFTQEEMEAFKLTLSEERLAYWKKLAAHGNLAMWRSRVGCRMPPTEEFAVLLHEWNAALSFSLLASLQIFEISLRNHMHAALTAHFQSASWWGVMQGGQFVASDCLVGRQADAVNDAIRVAARRTKGVTPGGVVSELSFGFWLGLISVAYDNPRADRAHWRNCLGEVFSKAGRVSRKEAHEELEHIIAIRNKCAHHDPIVHLSIVVEFANILAFARRFNRHTAEWITRTSLVPHLMKPDWLEAMRVSGRLIGSSVT